MEFTCVLVTMDKLGLELELAEGFFCCGCLKDRLGLVGPFVFSLKRK